MFSIWHIFQAALLIVNAIAVLNEERFLRRSMIFNTIQSHHSTSWICVSARLVYQWHDAQGSSCEYFACC